MNVNDYIGWRVLVTIGDNDAIRETAISRLSPNGKYVCLDSFYKEVIGWVPIDQVKIIDPIASCDRDKAIEQLTECKPGGIVRVSHPGPFGGMSPRAWYKPFD